METIEQFIEKEPALHDALSNLPEKKKEAVYAIYAYFKTAKKAARIDKDLEALQEMKKDTKDTFEGQVPKKLLFEKLYESAMRFPNDITPYMELLDGVKDDYYQKEIKTDEDLEAYAAKTMGNFTKMLLPVLAQKTFKENPKPLKSAAASLAHALTITTILRNVRDDLIDRRLFFPTDIMEQNKVKIETLRTGIVTPEYRSMVEQYIDKALEEFETFYGALEHFDNDAIEPVFTALKYYEGLLREIRKNDYNNITKRHKLSKFRKWLLRRKTQKELQKRGLKKS